MPEYVNVAQQTVLPARNVLFSTDAIPCKKGYVIHRDGSGIFTLRGIVNSSSCFAQYKVTFGGNISTADGTAQTQTSIGFAINGEIVDSSIATETEIGGVFRNVSSTMLINVPRGCCYTFSVKNATADGTTPIEIANANLIIERTA